jgi:hypothetical protein
MNRSWVREASTLSSARCRLALLLSVLIVAAAGVAAAIVGVIRRSPALIYLNARGPHE